MKRKLIVIMCALLLAIPILGFTQNNKGHRPYASAYEFAKENERFKENRDLFNNKENIENRAEVLAEKEQVEANKKAGEIQDKGEGQFKVKF